MNDLAARTWVRRRPRDTDQLPAEYWFDGPVSPRASRPVAPLRRLVLWDLAVLVPAEELDTELHRRVAARVLGWPSVAPEPAGGRTDPELAWRTLLRNGVPAARAAELVPVVLPGLAVELAGRGLSRRDLAGVPAVAGAVLAAVGRIPGVGQAVISGSVRANALRKIRGVGLGAHLAADVGAYGSEQAGWGALISLAVQRAVRHRGLTRPERTVLVTGAARVAEAARCEDLAVVPAGSSCRSGVPDLAEAANVLGGLLAPARKPSGDKTCLTR
ncbi:hypothetical protein [Amycolatopsis sp. YIM 10]|uniref:hypothetical protein n=1 Tax=Amycolatopsis sp. YIM 10 TaxID=2653857 RepID=UPI0012901980|nr:hypothetical protein [Amycolatopsis sp. YIM 10]QFU90556.1 hypothetical protein YIM_26910 [Amycolatopsis sp. YIM 10]